MLRLVLVRILETYFRHRWLYLLPILIMIAAAIVYYTTAKPVYISRSVFYVQKESILTSITSLRDSVYTWETPAQDTVGEFNELFQTDAFVRSVIERTDLEEGMDQSVEVVEEIFEDLRKNVLFSTLGDNQVRIRAYNENPLIAQQLANASFETYIQWKINADRNDSQVAAEFLVGLVDEYQSDMENSRQVLNDYLISHPEPLRGDRSAVEELEINRLQSELNLAEERYSNALDKDEDARLALAQAENAIRQTYFLIDAPEIPLKPGTSLKETAINMGLFVLVGVIISGIGIVGSALLDRTFRFPIDVYYLLDLNLLTEVPDVSPKRPFWRRKQSPKETETPVALDDPDQISDYEDFIPEPLDPISEIIETESDEKEMEPAK